MIDPCSVITCTRESQTALSPPPHTSLLSSHAVAHLRLAGLSLHLLRVCRPFVYSAAAATTTAVAADRRRRRLGCTVYIYRASSYIPSELSLTSWPTFAHKSKVK